MKLMGILLLLAGWFNVLAAIVLLPAAGSRTLFVIAGAGIQIVGLVLLIRSHRIVSRNER